MSFYYGEQQPNPFSSPAGNRHPAFNFFNQGPPPAHHFGPRHPYHLYRQHPFFAAQQFFEDDEPHHSPSTPAAPPAPAPAPRQSTLDEEERAALAHLEAIRRRKAEEQESIKREAEARLKAKRERELAIQRAIAEKEREEAIARLVKQKEEEYARQLAIRKVIENKRNEEIQRRREQYFAAQEAKQRYIQEVIARKAECAKRHAARYAAHASRQAAKEAQKQYGGEFEQLNQVLGSLFGINLAPSEEVSEKKEEKKEVNVEKKQEIKEKKEVHFGQAQSSTSAPPHTEKREASFPEDVNDLLTQFLGLRVEPTTETKTAPSSGSGENNVPAGLNEFLSQFGLVFEPLDLEKETAETKEEVKATSTPSTIANKPVVADPEVPALPPSVPSASAPAISSSGSTFNSTAAAKSTPKVDDAPLTAFLNSFTDLPPFVRDILGNVELAFKEELRNKKQENEVLEGKGKGVASGEKNPTTPPSIPTPAQSVDTSSSKDSHKSLDKLNSISSELSLVKESFEFPSTLAFASTSESTDIVPNLLYNKTNKSYHSQSNKLLQLLLDADSIESDGNKEVRKLRKAIVGDVENAIKELEEKRDEIWKEVKERREKGEEFELWEDESVSSSSRNSVVDAEHVEDVKGFEVEDNQHSEVLFDAPVDEEEKVKGEEVLEGNNQEIKDVKEDTIIEEQVGGEAADEKIAEAEKEHAEKERVAKVEVEKEEGYELL